MNESDKVRAYRARRATEADFPVLIAADDAVAALEDALKHLRSRWDWTEYWFDNLYPGDWDRCQAKYNATKVGARPVPTQEEPMDDKRMSDDELTTEWRSLAKQERERAEVLADVVWKQGHCSQCGQPSRSHPCGFAHSTILGLMEGPR
jgi:hypothetical protein